MKHKVLFVLVIVLGVFLVSSTMFAAFGWSLKSSSSPWGARSGSVSFVKNNKVWLLGGLNVNSVVKNDIWNTHKNDGGSWAQVSISGPLWVPRAMASGLIYNDKMWVMGGFDSAFNSLNDVWSSSNGSDWAEVTNSAEWSLRHGAASVVYNNKMWIMGGGTPNSSFTTLNDVWSSTNGINWTQEISNAPWTARRYSALVNFNGKMFLLGGLNASNGPLNDVWSSVDGANWTQEVVSAPWVGRGGHQAVVYDNKLWVMGGTIPRYPASTSEHFNDVWSSIDGVTWVQEPNAPWEAREFFSSVVSGSNIWVMGGGINVPTFSDVWKFN